MLPRVLCRLTVIVLAGAFITGCTTITPAGPLRTQSTAGEPVMLLIDEREAIYESRNQPESSFIVSTVPIQHLINGTIENGQVVHLELLWEPMGGATPLSPTATNISIRHVVFAEGEVGVYAGAGFAVPDGDIGDGTVSMRVRSGTLRLAESTQGFVDRLGEAEMVGSFKASHAPGTTSAARFALSQLVTDALGKSIFVMHDGTHSTLSNAYIDERLEYLEADLTLLLAHLARE
jgi:hypothetical protein